MLQAILSTEYDGTIRKRGTSVMLRMCVERLLSICGREISMDVVAIEPKIHATNILRTLFRNKDLDEQMTLYVERALILAVQGIQSSRWNVSLFSDSFTIMIDGYWINHVTGT